MDIANSRKRIEAAYQLLKEGATSRQKFEAIRALIHGINPKLDTALASASETLSDVEKFQKDEVIELAAEHLPENTEEEKRRKKALLLFIQTWKQLQDEVERIRGEFEIVRKNETPTIQEKLTSAAKIASFAKGPFGIITIAAVLVACILILTKLNKTTDVQKDTPSAAAPSAKTKIKVIDVNGKKIPLSETIIGQGPECIDQGTQAPHYHAKNHVKATAMDGTTVQDPGGCGFGKVKDVRVLEF